MPKVSSRERSGGTTTIYDVAAAAGVSPATVSRVFSGASGVGAEKRDAVLAAAKLLGFVPNRNARRLRTRSSELIALILGDIENPFNTAITRAVEDIARAEGYSIIVCSTDDDLDRERELLRAVVSEPVAGVIIAPASVHSRLDFALDRGVPVVCVDRNAPSSEVDSVVTDNVDAARRSVEALFDAGHTRIACVTGPVGTHTADERAAGWAEAVRFRTGAEPPADLLRRSTFSVEGGEASMRSLLAEPTLPDAVFAANNKLAIGVLRVLFSHDLVPPAVGVASLGELPLVTWTPSEVMISHLPARELGATAAAMLLERIRGLEGAGRLVVVPSIDGAEAIVRHA